MGDIQERLGRAIDRAERRLARLPRRAQEDAVIEVLAPVALVLGLDAGELARPRGIPAQVDLPAVGAPWVAPDVGEAWVAAARPAPAPGVNPAGPGRGFPAPGPWLTHYGDAAALGDLRSVAARHRVITIDADPGVGNFTAAQLQQLKAGGRNRVLSYLNLGALEDFRDYARQVPGAARLGAYEGYPDEQWVDPANPAWRKVVLDTILPRLVAQGVDGFYLDNLELLSHPGTSPASRQAGLDLVAEIRRRYPNMLIVLQNGTGDVTRLGRAGGRPFAELLDGVSHEEVFTHEEDGRYRLGRDEEALAELRAWRGMGLMPGGRPLAIAVQEYANAERDPAIADAVRRAAAAEGFTPFIGDRSNGLQ